MRGLLELAATAALALALAPGARAQDYTFKLHHFLGPDTPTQTETLEPWVEAVEANSGGRVSIEIYPAMTLGGRPPELVQQARDGVVDLIWTVNGYTPGLFPRSEVFELPNVHVNDPVATNLAMAELFPTDLAQDYAGLEVMFLHVHAGNAVQIAGVEVHAPGDLGGVKLRVPSRTGAWSIEALGATPVAMPVPDLPQALAKGVVEGALLPFEMAAPLKLQDQTDYQIEGTDDYRLGTLVFQLSMNKDRWDGLPPDIQAAFRDASGPDWLARLGQVWRETDDAAISQIVADGNAHIVWSPEETADFRAALEPVVDRWVAEVSGQGVDGAALVDRARALIAENAAR